MQTTAISQYEIERRKPAPRYKRSRVQANLIGLLLACRERYDILPELDIELNGKPFVPDICVYPKGQPDWFGEEEPFRAPPLLAIEIISPSQSIEQLLSRANEYLSAGANAVWIVVPALQTLYALTAPNAKPIAFNSGIVRDEKTGIELSIEESFR